jgi:hypothetical protein
LSVFFRLERPEGEAGSLGEVSFAAAALTFLPKAIASL